MLLPPSANGPEASESGRDREDEGTPLSSRRTRSIDEIEEDKR